MFNNYFGGADENDTKKSTTDTIKDALFGENKELDLDGRIRVDDWEMDPDVQQKVADIWPQVTTENLKELTDFNIYQKEFLELFGFGIERIDYNEDANVEKEINHLV